MCARRNYSANYGRPLTLEELQRGPVQVADPLRVDVDLRELEDRLSFGDPLSDTKAVNFDKKHLVITTKTTVDTEEAYAHGLDRIPVAFLPVAVAKTGYRQLTSLYATKNSDSIYIYLAVSDAIETSRTGVILVW